MISSKGNAIANQFIIKIDDTLYFQSYKSIIVKIEPNGNVYLDKRYWDYSNTIGKYRNQFLGETKKETVAKINDGIYKLVNLN